MRKALFTVLVFLSLLALTLRFGIKPAYSLLGFQDRSGLKITSNPSSRVILNDKPMGKTPFQDETLSSGNYNLKLDTENNSWETGLNLTDGTISVVDHDFNQSNLLSSGEILSLVSGSGVVITSSPIGADVMLDGVSYGKTPISLSSIKAGEHEFTLSADHYQKKGVKADVLDNMKLIMSVDLPLISIDNSLNLSQPQISNYVVVKGTPNGFLRLRDTPSTNGSEVGKVNEGDVLTLVETQSGWVKVKLDNGTVGFVASNYIQKQ